MNPMTTEQNIALGIQRMYYNEPGVSKLWPTYECVLLKTREG